MESLNARKDAINKCLSSLDEAITLIYDSNTNPELKKIQSSLRDSLIQRFEFTFDTFWKYLKNHLEESVGVEFEYITPKEIFKQALKVKLLTGDEYTLLIMTLEDRNLTSHTYNEQLAVAIATRIENYYSIFRHVTIRLESI